MPYKKIPFAWIVHGYPAGHQSNATPDDEQYVQDYYKNFPRQLNTPSQPGEQFIKETLPNGYIAYTAARTGIYAANERKSEPNYAAVTIFIDSKYKTLDESFLERKLNGWFKENILNQFTQWQEKRRGLFNKTAGYYWKKNYTELFNHQYDNELTKSLESIIQSNFQEKTNVQQTNQPRIPRPQQPTVTTQQNPEPTDKDSTPNNEQTTSGNTLYADFIDDGELTHVTESPNDDTNFILTKISNNKYELSLYPPAYPRILRNPAGFLQGTDKQVMGYDIVQIKELGVVRKDAFSGKFKIEKKLEVHILKKHKTETLQQNPEPAANNTTKKKLYSMSILDGRLYKPKSTPDDDTVFELTETAPGTYEIDIYPPAHKRILANPSFLEGCEKQIVGNEIVKVIERGIARDNGLGKLIVEKPPRVETLDRDAENTTNKNNAEKIASYDKGRKQLEDEIEKLEQEIQEKQQLLRKKREQLTQMGNQNT